MGVVCCRTKTGMTSFQDDLAVTSWQLVEILFFQVLPKQGGNIYDGNLGYEASCDSIVC